MQHRDTLVVTRTSQVKDPITRISKSVTQSFGPYKCSNRKSSGNISQGTPQSIFVQHSKLFIRDMSANIKFGDIACINGVTKYTVGDVYYANNKHIEVDIEYLGEA